MARIPRSWAVCDEHLTQALSEMTLPGAFTTLKVLRVMPNDDQYWCECLKIARWYIRSMLREEEDRLNALRTDTEVISPPVQQIGRQKS